MNDILSTQQVAELLECERGQVMELARARKLPGVKLGRSWIFPREALLQRLNELALQPAPRRPLPTAVLVPTVPDAPRGRGRPSRPLPKLPDLSAP